ncbi:hypothetical protein C7N43_10265 [Sphingobacteriales bacterium UPWRP_1]|nr:hypothetical protein C7N43_10265 [Sphingobacteriales bacterium UPWRP_1]
MKDQLIPANLNPAQASEALNELLEFLKEQHSLTSRAIEADINFKGLSKARKFSTYQQRKVSGIKLPDILAMIADHYQIEIFYNPNTNKYYFESLSGNDPGVKETYMHYYYYYFSHWNQTVSYAVITFFGQFTKARLTFFDSDGSPIFQSGKGKVWRSGATLFAQLPNSHPEHMSLICLYVGNNRKLEEFEWIAGTYASTRLRDEAPVCGVVVLRKIGVSDSVIPETELKVHVIPDFVKKLLLGKRLGVSPTVAFKQSDLNKIISSDF